MERQRHCSQVLRQPSTRVRFFFTPIRFAARSLEWVLTSWRWADPRILYFVSSALRDLSLTLENFVTGILMQQMPILPHWLPTLWNHRPNLLAKAHLITHLLGAIHARLSQQDCSSICALYVSDRHHFNRHFILAYLVRVCLLS